MRQEPGAQSAALLIDADNIGAQGVDFAVTHLRHQGWRLTIKRAYGGHDKLAGMKDCLLRHGVRALVNHGKGTTDALLVVDVMDLLHEGRLPPVVAIASSDADFAPLAVRLREAGSWVICFAQAKKSADSELARCYDELLYVDVPASAPEPAVPPPARGAARKKKHLAQKQAALPFTPSSAPPDPLRALLESIEGFREGRELALNEVVKKLRAQELLGKNASGAAFLKKHAPYVELRPAQQPNKVRLKEADA
jgi:hypothetical protein